jgi:hypothetical protein
MKLKSANALAGEVRAHFERQGIQGSSAIARATSLGQPQVHRNVFGKPKRVTKTLKGLCDYADIDLTAGEADPRESATLIAALSQVWDGTEVHARRLARLLFAHHRARVRN